MVATSNITGGGGSKDASTLLNLLINKIGEEEEKQLSVSAMVWGFTGDKSKPHITYDSHHKQSVCEQQSF